MSVDAICDFGMMCRYAFVILFLFFVVSVVKGQVRDAVVADSVTRMPLSNASVFDREGKFAGISMPDGKIPRVPESDYPITVRYMGYGEAVVRNAGTDTIFMQEIATDLPEVVVESRDHKVLHMLAYVREYSTLMTYTDTVFLFREKMADYMIPRGKKQVFVGWNAPRVLKSKSYYRYSNAHGLDSVSDRCNYHFSWTDWVGVAQKTVMPPKLCSVENGSDTVAGRYAAAEVWNRNGSRVAVDVDVLADTTRRKWVANLSGFFRNNIDFARFNVRFSFNNVAGDSVLPDDVTGYSFAIESRGRGHGMFMFNRVDEPYFVSTYAEVYVVDKEYITVKEAKKWERRGAADWADLAIYEPEEVPDLQPSVARLIDRVNSIDGDGVRLTIAPDQRLIGRNVVRQKNSVGERALQLLKMATGISRKKAERNWKRQWSGFSREQIVRNNRKQEE
ncbi:MAG: carboxypeptidase-like regulatory domain-containing protein [Muribaculaceae bacterium]|nr:carboxypeptidase-like regulatory domain-containing protein [Muribaculaceae bacterium]